MMFRIYFRIYILNIYVLYNKYKYITYNEVNVAELPTFVKSNYLVNKTWVFIIPIFMYV